MTTQIVAIGFVALIVVCIIGVGWWQIYDHGADNAKAKELKRRADAADKRAERASEAPASKREARRILRDRLKRLSRRMRD